MNILMCLTLSMTTKLIACKWSIARQTIRSIVRSIVACVQFYFRCFWIKCKIIYIAGVCIDIIKSSFLSISLLTSQMIHSSTINFQS